MCHSDSSLHVRSNRRAGLVAMTEMLLMIVLLAGMFWLVSQFTSAMTNEPQSAKSSADACSDRGVYRISIDCDEDRLWIYRPRDGLTRLNLVTNMTEQLVALPVGLSTIAHSRDGSTTLMCSSDGELVLTRNGDAPQSAHVSHEGEIVVDSSVSLDGETAVCVTNRGQVHGWRRYEGAFQYFTHYLAPGAPIAKVGLNRSGQRMYVGRFDGTAVFFDPISGRPDGQELRLGGAGAVECTIYAWSGDGRFLAACSDGRLRVCDVETGNQVFETVLFDGRNNRRPTSLEFSDDGSRLAVTTNVSPEICVWDVEAGKLAGILHGHKGVVRSLQFASSDRLFSGSYDGSVREWSLDTWGQIRIVD